MNKELKISELANIWGTSVPTTWNRIRKEGLITFKKKDENNKEVNFVSISEEILNNYINNINNPDNNVYYEDMLKVNNVVNSEKQAAKEFNSEDIKDIINTITTVNNDYNDRLKTLTDELITYKSKTLLLEDAKGREGYYINEISELKKENNRSKLYNKIFIAIITVLICAITYCVTVMTVSKSDTVSDTVEVKSDIVQEQPKAQPISKPIQKRK